MNSYIVKAAGILGSIAFAVSAGMITASADSTATALTAGTSFMNGLSAQHINVSVNENGSLAAAAPDVVKELIAQLENCAPAAPELSSALVTADNISVSVENLSEYQKGTIFNVYVNGVKNSSFSLEELRKDNTISVTNSMSEYFQSETSYYITVEPQYKLLTSKSRINLATENATYFRIDNGTLYYGHNDSGFYAAGYVPYVSAGAGEQVSDVAEAVSGQSPEAVTAEYVKITDGDYKGMYVKLEDTERVTSEEAKLLVEQGKKNKADDEEKARQIAEEKKKQEEAAKKAAEAKKAEEAKKASETASAGDTAQAGNENTSAAVSDRDALIKIVCDYAKSNVGGAYVYCGASYRACDCSGLTMLCYQQIGINLPHFTGSQAQCGRRVSVSEMQPGDIIICNNYGHAMIYVGDGMLVHAMNPSKGIRMEEASYAMRYNPVNCVIRII